MPTWPIPDATPTPSADVAVSIYDRTISAGSGYGRGLLRPFRRDEKNDFANAEGAKLVRACVGQVLGTRCSSETTIGEMPWRPEFGSLLQYLRHQKNDVALQELARVYVVDALRRWEPRVRVTSITVTPEKTADGGLNMLVIKLMYNLVDVSGTNVLMQNIEQTLMV